MVAGLQYNVGTDYFSYIDIFQSEEKHWYYFNKGEYLFFGLNQFLNWLNLPEQSIFLVISFIQSFLIFLYFKKIKKRTIKLLLMYFLFIDESTDRLIWETQTQIELRLKTIFIIDSSVDYFLD